MQKLFSCRAIAIPLMAVAIVGCVTYTPITAPALTLPKANPPVQTQPAQQPIPVPPPIPDTVAISIRPNQEPTADEGGTRLIEAYAEAQKNIKNHNKQLTNR
jgi:hypothetical protein